MTVILIVVVGVAITTGLTALILYARHIHRAMRQQLAEAEERLRLDLAALSIVLRPPEPPIPKPRGRGPRRTHHRLAVGAGTRCAPGGRDRRGCRTRRHPVCDTASAAIV